MSHSSASLLIVLGVALPPASTAIGPHQDRTSLFCLVKFYCVAFQNNNSYTGTCKARKAHRQGKTCLQLIKATRIAACKDLTVQHSLAFQFYSTNCLLK